MADTKTILITGANRGIGLALCRQYLSLGYRVIAACRHPEKASSLHTLLEQYSGMLSIEPLDVLSDESVSALAQGLKGSALNKLINNAGVYGPKGEPLGATTSRTQALEVMATNSIAPLKLVEALLGNLADGSVIVNVSSKMGSMSDNLSGGAYIYRASKAALNAITKSLSLDLAEKGVTVLAVHPGWVQTDMGGANALIDADTSTDGLRQVIENASLADSGCFYNYDGSHIPW